MTFIIGLAGPAGVGKTTTARGITDSLKLINKDLDVHYSAFATPLYYICSYLTGIAVETLASQDYKNIEWTNETAPLPCLVGWTPRKFIQKTGTECFRHVIHMDFWVQVSRKLLSKHDIVIMGDARFENEFRVADYNIELNRPGIEYAGDHASSMKPDPSLMNTQLQLYPDISFLPLAQNILTLYTEKRKKNDLDKHCI
jgi:hypothetical protein